MKISIIDSIGFLMNLIDWLDDIKLRQQKPAVFPHFLSLPFKIEMAGKRSISQSTKKLNQYELLLQTKNLCNLIFSLTYSALLLIIRWLNKNIVFFQRQLP